VWKAVLPRFAAVVTRNQDDARPAWSVLRAAWAGFATSRPGLADRQRAARIGECDTEQHYALGEGSGWWSWWPGLPARQWERAEEGADRIVVAAMRASTDGKGAWAPFAGDRNLRPCVVGPDLRANLMEVGVAGHCFIARGAWIGENLLRPAGTITVEKTEPDSRAWFNGLQSVGRRSS
jgi:hypothetical protein